jgi:hypothetical protein
MQSHGTDRAPAFPILGRDPREKSF